MNSWTELAAQRAAYRQPRNSALSVRANRSEVLESVLNAPSARGLGPALRAGLVPSAAAACALLPKQRLQRTAA